MSFVNLLFLHSSTKTLHFLSSSRFANPSNQLLIHKQQILQSNFWYWNPLYSKWLGECIFISIFGLTVLVLLLLYLCYNIQICKKSIISNTLSPNRIITIFLFSRDIHDKRKNNNFWPELKMLLAYATPLVNCSTTFAY